MNKDLRNNERYLKELADKHKPVPPPMVWDEIEQVLDKDRGKKRLFPFIWTCSVFLVGAIMVIHLSGNGDKAAPLAEQETMSSDYHKQSDTNPKDIQTGADVSEDNNEVIHNEVNPEQIKQEQRATLLKTKSETIPSPSNNQGTQKTNAEKPGSYVTQQQSIKLNTASVDKSSEANTNTSNSNTTAINTKDDISRQSLSTSSSLEEKNSLQIATLQRLEWVRRSLETSIPHPTLSKNLTAIPLSRYRRRGYLSSPWFVEFGGGIGRNLNNPALVDTEQNRFRLDTESKWYSWSASLKLGYQFDNDWYTTLGVDLNQTKNRFDFFRRDVSSLIVSENERFEITNSDFFTTGETNYTFADIGLSIGQRVHIDKWHFSLEGGPIFNLLFNANGKVQVGDLEFSRLEAQDNYFKTRIGVGARLSAMLDYPISDQLWISLGPTYHQYFSTVSAAQNPLEERNAILQVKAKVRYHF